MAYICKICGKELARSGRVTIEMHERSKFHQAALNGKNETEIIKPVEKKVEKPIPAKVESVKIPEPIQHETVQIHETKPLETKPDEPTKQKSEKESKEDEWDGYYC